MTLGDALYQVGKLEESLGYYKETFVGLRRLEGGDFDVRVANCLSAMACICSDLGRLEEGEVQGVGVRLGLWLLVALNLIQLLML
jgi:hypothetical protein